MAQAGIVKTITGFVTARTPDGHVRQLMAGDMVNQNEIIATSAGSQVSIELSSGQILTMAEGDQIALDETVLAAVDAQDAVVTEVEALQAALELGEDLPGEEPAAGEEDAGHDYNLAYYAGDQTRGDVGSYLFGTEYGGGTEIFPDVGGEEEAVPGIDPILSAINVFVDETDIQTANTATGTITVDFGVPGGGTLALSAAGAVWDAAASTLTFQQGGTDIWQIVLDQDTGKFTFEQLAAVDHGPDGNNPNALAGFGVTVLATNSLGNTATTTFTAGVYDDGPAFVDPNYGEGSGSNGNNNTLITDETYSLNDDGQDDGHADGFSPAAVDFGTDGPLVPGAFSMSVNDVTPDHYEWNDTTQTLTFYQVAGGDATWQIQVVKGPLFGEEQQYEYVLTQLSAVYHGDASDPDDSETWTVTAAATDSDEDRVYQTIKVTIDDDGPSLEIGEGIQNINVDETDVVLPFPGATESFTSSFGVDFGADGEAATDAVALSMDGFAEGVDYKWDGTMLSFYQNADAETAATATWTIAVTLDTDTGKYGFDFTQLEAIDHSLAGDGTNNTHDETQPQPGDLPWVVRVTATDGDGDTASATFNVTIDDDGPRMTGNEILTAELGTAADAIPSPEASSPEDVIGVVTGDAEGEFGTDGPGGFFLWDASAAAGEEKTGHILVEDSGTPVYEIFMDSQTGQWTVYQYQPIAEDTLEFDFRIYDGDDDWAESQLQVPVSQFVVGSDVDGLQEAQDPYENDVPGSDDTHTVPTLSPTGDDQGAILGQDAADVLVGDPGSAEGGSFSSNYIMVMDISSSMRFTDGDQTSRFADLKTATKDMIQDLYDQVDNSTSGEVRINLQPFSTDLVPGAWISFAKVGGTVVIENSVDDLNPATDNMDEINNWIDNLPLGKATSYTDALTGANLLVDNNYDENHVIFISDGVPSVDEDPATGHSVPLQILAANVDSIRAVGISMDASGEAILNNIDTTGDAASIDNSSELSAVIGDIISVTDLGPVGSDVIDGGDGNDLIFGDVLNTDGVFDSLDSSDYDLSTIEDLPDGSGWEVFAKLEAANPDSWTRADTIRYIQENHEDLAKETLIDGEGREGGNDIIHGGDGDDIIYGQEGNDTIDAGAGDDVIDGGTGNDFIDGGTGTNTIDGGDGLDTLMVSTDAVLDFSQVDNIETIHLNPGVEQHVTISLDDVLNMTDSDNVLQISGDDVDTVTLTGVGTGAGEWTQDATDHGLFTLNGSGTDPDTNPLVQVSIADLADGIDIHVDVDNGGTSFDV